MEIEDARGPSAADRCSHLRRAHENQQNRLQTDEQPKRAAGLKRAILNSRPEDAETKHLHHHDRRDQWLDTQPRPYVLDQDRIVEPVENSLPIHHDSSFEPTLRNNSSRLSLRRSNEATRTPLCTRVVSK